MAEQREMGMGSGGRKAGLGGSILAEAVSFLRRNITLIAIGVVLECAFILLLQATDMRRDTNRLELFFYIPFAVYIVAVLWVVTGRYKASAGRSSTKERARLGMEAFTIILVFAIIFRAIFLMTAPSWSDDVYRYYWEGKVSNEGVNPYLDAPDDENLSEYRDAEWAKMSNRDISSPYPPMSQVAFALCYFIYPSIYTFKAFFLIFDVLSICVIFLLLRGFKIDPHYALIYAWCPLVAVDIAHSGHNDPMVMFLVLVSFLFLQKRMRAASSVALALAALTKIYPALFAPVLFRTWGWKYTTLFFAVIGVLYLPFLGAGGELFAGMSVYFDRWFFNGSVFPVLVEGFRPLNLEGGPKLAAKYLIIIIFSIAVVYIVRRSWRYVNRPEMLLGHALLLTAVFLILTTTVHPWYILWVVPFLCFFPYFSFIVLSGTVMLSYYVYIDYDHLNIWKEWWWVRVLEYAPFYIILVYEVYIKRSLFRGPLDEDEEEADVVDRSSKASRRGGP